MPDLFLEKKISPMLLNESEPFDDPNYIYELKLDGIRTIVYLDSSSTVIRNKRNKDVTDIYPELKNIHKNVKIKCILDGEIICLKNGKPDFFEVQKRSLMNNPFKIEMASQNNPVVFVCYDIIYLKDEDITQLPLIKRKELMLKHIKEDYFLSISRYIEKNGQAFFKLAKSENLEGIVAKEKNSIYYQGVRAKNWFKIKVMQEEDLIVCGFEYDENDKVKSLVLGYYTADGALNLRGKIGIIGNLDKQKIDEFAIKNSIKKAWFDINDNIVWLKLKLVGTVSYMQKTASGGMRQPVWKGLRDDKLPQECIEKE